MFAYNHAWGFKRGGIALQKAVDEVITSRADRATERTQGSRVATP